MSRRSAVEVLVLIVYLAMIFALVRPGSQGPALVSALGAVLTGLISAAVGGGAWVSAPASESGQEQGDQGGVNIA